MGTRWIDDKGTTRGGASVFAKGRLLLGGGGGLRHCGKIIIMGQGPGYYHHQRTWPWPLSWQPPPPPSPGKNKTRGKKREKAKPWCVCGGGGGVSIATPWRRACPRPHGDGDWEPDLGTCPENSPKQTRMENLRCCSTHARRHNGQ